MSLSQKVVSIEINLHVNDKKYMFTQTIFNRLMVRLPLRNSLQNTT